MIDHIHSSLKWLSILLPLLTQSVYAAAPVSDTGGPYNGLTGVPVQFDGTASSDDGTITEYLWKWGDGTQRGIGPNYNTPKHTYSTPGTYSLSLRVTDNEGLKHTDTTQVVITAAQAPVADIGGPYNGLTGEKVVLDGTASSDADGTIVRYWWEWGDGSPRGVGPAYDTPRHIYTTPGTFTASLTVTDNDGLMHTDIATVTIKNPVPPTADPGGPYTAAAGITFQLDGSVSTDADGTIVRYWWEMGDGSRRKVGPNLSMPIHTYAATGNYNVSLTVTDDDGLEHTATTQVTVENPTAELAHNSIYKYKGPETCIACHESQAVAMHGSVHYQQTGPAMNLTNDVSSPSNPDGLAGEWGSGAIGMNTYCGTHDNSPRFTCAACHVGNGRYPQADLPTTEPERSEELANIDCMMCHQENYVRYPAGPYVSESIVAVGELDGLPDPLLPPISREGFEGNPIVDPVTLDFEFEPADENSSIGLAGFPLMVNRVLAAQEVHPTTRQSCLNCHATMAGGTGAKRGDISSALVDPTADIDIHMNTTGNNFSCSTCHNAGGHRLRGRGLDLRPNDVADRFSCETCHTSAPHGDYSSRNGAARDTHAGRVACQSCHIPTYAKGQPTEISRDWSQPYFSDNACNGRAGWQPQETVLSDVIPTYRWFNGTSQVYVLGENLGDYPTTTLDGGATAYNLGVPNGDVTDPDARIHPMKEHISVSARHIGTNQLIAHSTDEYYRTGDFDASVQSGMTQSGLTGAYDLVNLHTFQTISHGVEAMTSALDCGSCHNSLAGGPLRMDLQNDLGYALKGPQSTVCTQCHSSKSGTFSFIHSFHVNSFGFECSWCHTFSRPLRNLN